MNKLSKLLALALAMCLIFCACGEKKEETSTTLDDQYKDYDYSACLDEKGYFKDVKALDYVTLPELTKVVVSKEELDKQIESVMSNESYMKGVADMDPTHTVEDGDTVSIDYVGSIDGVEFDGGTTHGMGTEVTIGVTNYIDDFLEQLVGHHPGETINVEVTFPEDYGEESLNGKDAVFVTTINYILTYERNELTDAFVEEYFADDTGWTTVEEFKKGCAEVVGEDIMYNSCTFADTLPEVVEQAYVDRMMSDLCAQASQYGMTMDSFVAAVYSDYGMTLASQAKAAYEAYKTVIAKEYLLNQALAEKVGFTVSDADISAYYERYEIAEDTIDAVVEAYGKPYITSMALYDKAMDYIHSIVVVE